MADSPAHQQVLDATEEMESSMRLQSVSINAYETTAAVVVVAPFPAVQPEDVTVEVEGRTLRMFAGLRSAGPRDYLVKEWDYGGYEREFELPEGFGGGVEASLANGQLAIRVLRGDANENVVRIMPTPTAESAD